jgi:N-acyl homoserine lactone hydrolase
VLRGRSLTSDEGSLGFCAVNLVSTSDTSGAPRRILFDTGHAGRRRALVRALHGLGLTPGDIDAAVLVNKDEPAYAEAPGPDDLATPSWTGSLLRHLGARAIGDRETIADGVATLHLPGHTAGSLGLTVETPEGRHVLTGDAVSGMTALRTPRCSVVHHDEQQARASVELVATLADVVWPGHDRPFAVRDGRPGAHLDADVPLEFASAARTL